MTILTFYFAQVFILAASINYQVKNCHKQVSNALPFCHLKHVHTIIILKTLIWSLPRCGQQILYTAAKIKHNEQWTALRTGSLTKITPNTFIIVVMFSVCDCFSLIIKNQNELKLLGEQKQFKRKRILSHNNLQLQYYDAVTVTSLYTPGWPTLLRCVIRWRPPSRSMWTSDSTVSWWKLISCMDDQI